MMENFFRMDKDTQQKSVKIYFASREKQQSFLRGNRVCKEQKWVAECENSMMIVSSRLILTVKLPR